MGISVVLETEHGVEVDRVDDPDWALTRLIPPTPNDEYVLFSTIDEYGDTLFNRKQMPRLRDELARLSANVTLEAERTQLRAVDALAKRCQEGDLLYLKIYGD